MFEATLFTAIAYSLGFCLTYYMLVCIYARRLVALEFRKLLFYITVFSLFGISGEIIVNTVWEAVFSEPLWEYHLFPAHGGDISYFFIFVWGALGYYKYLNDLVIHTFDTKRYILPGIVMGGEAIFLELLYNGIFFLLFGSYIFYYLPENLGVFSHLSCLQVIPFYFIVGFVTNALTVRQDKVGYGKSILPTIAFYWMVIIALVVF